MYSSYKKQGKCYPHGYSTYKYELLSIRILELCVSKTLHPFQVLTIYLCNTM